MADHYPKELANRILAGEIQAPYTMSVRDAFRIAADIFTKSWQLHWDNHDKARYTYNLIPFVRTKVIFPKSREIGVSYCRLLLHDSMLKDDSHRTGTSDSPYCEDYETSEHSLLYCNSHNKARIDMMGYIKDTGVFAKLKGRISETLLLSPSCYDDYDLNKKDNKILKDALFQFLHQVNRTI